MRPDQEDQIEELSEKLADVFLTEANPDNWTGAGVPATQLDPATRGARNWDMKNANQAGALLLRSLDIRERMKELNEGRTRDWEGGDDAAEADIAKFEKQARSLLAEVGQRRGGP